MQSLSGAGHLTASRKEQALWLLEELVPGTGVNNVAFAIRLDGAFEMDALAAAVAVVARRYEVLRTVFATVDGVLVKRVVPAADFSVAIEAVDDSQDALNAFAGRSFSLDGTPLLRVGHGPGPDGDVLCVVVHHLVFDVFSIGVFVQALVTAYETLTAGGEPAGDPVPALEEAEPSEAAFAYWREQLRDYVPDGLDLWCGARDVRQPSLSGASVTYTLGAETRETVRRLRKELRAPEAAILLAAYNLLLVAHGAGPDVVIGTPVDVRHQPTPESIGYHVNVLPLRLRPDLAESFRAFARRARDVFLGSMAHADVSVDDVSAELPRSGSAWRDTLYRHMFNYFPGSDTTEFAIGGKTARSVPVENGYSKFDLEFFVMISAETIKLRAGYYTEVLGREDVEAMLRRFEALLAEVAADPDRPLGEVRAFSAEDRATIEAANRTESPTSESVLEAVHRNVWRSPDAPAVLETGRTVTYRQLWDAAQSVRADLGKGDLVAVSGPPSAALAAQIIGSWLAGAVCDPSGDPAPEPVFGESTGDRPLSPVAPDAEAYRLPGVTLTHGHLAALVTHLARALGVRPETGTRWRTRPGSAASLVELLLPLTTGGHLVTGPDGDARILRLTPAELLSTPAEALTGRHVICDGGRVPPSLARRTRDAGGHLHHVHGSTDRAIWSICDGRPVDAMRAAVLDPRGRELPVGVRGELWACSGGDRRPTGEIVRWRPDGTVELIGRLDRQATVLGRRVVLDEIEAGLLDHPEVVDAAVLGSDDESLVAFVAAPGGTTIETPFDLVVLDAIPRDADGRPDEAALRSRVPGGARDLPTADDPLVAALIPMWQALLRGTEVTATTNFFADGGHSLLAAKLVQDIEQLTGVRLDLKEIFAHPTPVALAAHLGEIGVAF
jgi:non-ribosomal peptide synthetase component F